MVDFVLFFMVYHRVFKAFFGADAEPQAIEKPLQTKTKKREKYPACDDVTRALVKEDLNRILAECGLAH